MQDFWRVTEMSDYLAGEREAGRDTTPPSCACDSCAHADFDHMPHWYECRRFDATLFPRRDHYVRCNGYEGFDDRCRLATD